MAKEEKNKDSKVKKHFFKDFKAELKKVIWPTPKQVLNNTIAVIVIVIITATIVFVLDSVFDLMNKYGINKLKQNIKNKVSIEEVENETANNEVIDSSNAEEMEAAEPAQNSEDTEQTNSVEQ